MIKKRLFLLIFLLNLSLGNQQYLRLKTGIHFDSRVSGGKYSLEELGHIIGRSDLDVAIITDHDNMEVRLGSQFFRRAFSIRVKRNSVATYGFEKYFHKINEINQYYPNVEILPGIEAVPYYSWQGRGLDQNLSLKNWHRHLLVFGLPTAEDYKNLPSLKTGFPVVSEGFITNIKHHFYYYFLITITLLLFLLTLVSCFKKTRKRRYRITIPKIIILILMGWFLVLEFPYLRSTVSQYNPDSNRLAYQHVIDYVIAKKGMVFWAHPEAEYQEEIPLNLPYFQNSLSITTDHYSHLVYETKNHTGFAGFWEGMKVLGKPGGLWDIALTEYCDGLREKPMFVIGELDFEETNNLKNINETNTFIFAKNRTQPAILEAIRQGRMYATRGFFGDKFAIDEFRAYNPQTEASAFIGETLNITNTPVALNIKIHTLKAVKPQTFTLYRNNIPIKDFIVEDAIDEWYVDKNIPLGEKFYYKLYAGKKWQSLVTNPIFVNNQTNQQ